MYYRGLIVCILLAIGLSLEAEGSPLKIGALPYDLDMDSLKFIMQILDTRYAMKSEIKAHVDEMKGELKSHADEMKTYLKDELKSYATKAKMARPTAAATKAATAGAPTTTTTATTTAATTTRTTTATTMATTTATPATTTTTVEQLIGIGKAKWDGDAGGGFKPEQAFSTSAATFTDYGCAGYKSSTRDFDQPWPILIWSEFPSSHVPARFSFRHVTNGETPKTWKFVGSKDEGCSKASPWIELCGDSYGNKELVDLVGEEVGCDVPKYAREPFKCLGIRVYSNNYPDDNAVCLKAMRFWEIGIRA